jgi:hypothetical protein
MTSENLHRRRPVSDEGRAERGQLVMFPDRRSFGPFSWRMVRIASFTLLMLFGTGALIEMYLWPKLCEVQPGPQNAARVPS